VPLPYARAQSLELSLLSFPVAETRNRGFPESVGSVLRDADIYLLPLVELVEGLAATYLMLAPVDVFVLVRVPESQSVSWRERATVDRP
jgi:hypothetical protein